MFLFIAVSSIFERIEVQLSVYWKKIQKREGQEDITKARMSRVISERGSLSDVTHKSESQRLVAGSKKQVL